LRTAPTPLVRALRDAGVAFALGAVAVVPLVVAGPAQAQTAAAARSYDIPAGPLAGALVRFAGEAGVSLAGALDLADGRTSAGLKGRYGVADGFAALVKGSGLAVVERGGTWAVVRAEAAPRKGTEAEDSELPPVTVRAAPEGPTLALPKEYAGGQVARGARMGVLGNRDFLDTPLATTSYTAELIRNQTAVQLSEVLANDPSVQVHESGNEFSYTTIRGLGLSQTFQYAVDGSLGLADQYQPALEPFERVEVIRGANALLNGFGSVSGYINLVTKRAQDRPNARLITTWQSRNQLGVHLDVGKRYGERNEWGIRANVAGRAGDGYVRENEQRYGLGAIAIDYRGPRLRASLDVHSTDRLLTGFEYFLGVDQAVGLPPAPDGRNNLATRFTRYNGGTNMVVARAEYDISDRATLFGTLGGQQFNANYYYTFGNIVSLAGNTNLTLFDDYNRFSDRVGEIGVRGSFDVGAWRNEYGVIAASNSFQRTTRSSNAIGPTIVSNIYNPVFGPEPVNTGGLPNMFTSAVHSKGVSVANTLFTPSKTVMLTFGVRAQRVEVDSSSTPSFSSQRLSPSAALAWRATPRFTVYGNSMQGLEAGAVVTPPALNAGTVIPPFVTRQLEAGVKYDTGRVGLQAAVFQLKRPAGFLDPATNVFGVFGERVNRGVEFSMFGAPMDGLRLLGGVTLLDPKITKSADINGDGIVGDLNGKTAAGVARQKVIFNAEYDIGRLGDGMLTLTGRVTYTGSTKVNPINTIAIPSVTVLDAGARFVTPLGDGRSWSIIANVFNLTDERYWQPFDELLLLNSGAPRTFRLAASYDF
jgi:iron complex outermembrane receptor protein